MLFSLFSFALISLSSQEVKNLIERVPVDWYSSTTRLFEYCVDVNFQHPICPNIQSEAGPIDYQNEFYTAPTGPLTSHSLFQATLLYQMGRPPDFWMATLNLDKPRPATIDPRLWAEAQALWAKTLFDKQKYKESIALFDQIVDDFKGKALFHQQRAWAQFFNGQYDRALGSIISAESPLIYKVPFFEKYFLRALIEKETCRRSEALNTLAVGRANLSYAKSPAENHPWTLLCEKRSLGSTCEKLKSWFDASFKRQIKKALEDLDLLEIELRDETANTQAKPGKSEIIWPSVSGENWQDELGHYSVPIKTKC
ncbi:MAG: hypothetical protein JWQ35_1121 [Bacteriovoracaceae bacterium]|nr:hypothetical protein [Bacteriovoracaceae bacterium]